MGSEHTNNFLTISDKGGKTCAHPCLYLHTAKMYITECKTANQPISETKTLLR